MMNIFPVNSEVSRKQREQRQGHRGLVFWITGLSGSGKSTLSIALEKKLFAEGCNVAGLDGDRLRSGLNKGLGFSTEDRSENLRRAGEVAKILANLGIIVISSFITPLESDRGILRSVLGSDFHDCFLDVNLSVCEKRDPKGLYKKARSGELKGMTGIDSPFEPPKLARLILHGTHKSIDELVDEAYRYVKQHISL